MRRACFVCLFLCFTTFLLSQTLPARAQRASGSSSRRHVARVIGQRHGRVVERNPGSRASRRLGFSTEVQGSVECNADYWWVYFSSSDITAWASFDGYYYKPQQPPVISANCGSPIQPGLGGGSVGDQNTTDVWGAAWVTVTCNVDTGVCTASVDGSVTLYPKNEEGPPLGSLSFSGDADASIDYYQDPVSGLIDINDVSGGWDLIGDESLPDPVPLISAPLIPMTTSPGSSGFVLTVNGFGFTSQSLVNWNGNARPTTFVSPAQLTATISGSDVAESRTSQVTISNPGSIGISNASAFSVTVPTSSVALGSSDLSTATQPESVVTGDFNGDGIVDLAVTNFSGSVSILLGNGDGTFRGHVDYATGAGARGIVAADFNGDGRLDLAVANLSANTVSILLGNGDGTFRGHVDYSAGTGPFALVAGDFNEDGALDLAVVDQSTNQLSILQGNGDGTFASSRPLSTGQLPFGIVTGDFNKDGHLDLAVTNYTDSTVSVFLGAGDGTFSTKVDCPTGASPEMLAAVDLNGDGNLDLAVGTNQATSSQISILLGNGDGTFLPHVDISAGSKPRSLFPADLNGDGKVDLAVANYGSSTVSVWFGNGEGTFSSRTDYPTGSSPQSIAAGDFTNDGRMDLATANYGANTATVLLQVPTVSLSPSSLNFGPQAIGTTSSPQTVRLANSGSATLSISSIMTQGDFAETNSCGATLAPGAGCDISVTFTPTAGGNRAGELALADNASDSPQTVPLSGAGLASTTTTLSSSLNPSHYGQQITFTAVVTPSGSGTPTGSVTFDDGATSLGSVILAKGVATLTTNALTAGSHSISATYSGDATFAASTSAPLVQTVAQASPTVTLSSGLNPSYVGQQVTLSAIVSAGPATPTGTITFKQGSKVVGTTNLENGQASLAIAFAKSGNYSIVASYSGDQNYSAKVSKTLKQVVKKYTTTTSLASSPNPSVQGQPVTFTATVNSPGPAPTGKVTFYNGSKSLGKGTLAKGVATLTTSKLPKGSLSITATYAGDVASNRSTSTVLTQVVD